MKRKTVGILFSDIAGFSRLHDDELPDYLTILDALNSELIERNRGHIVEINTWGDAIMLAMRIKLRKFSICVCVPDALN